MFGSARTCLASHRHSRIEMAASRTVLPLAPPAGTCRRLRTKTTWPPQLSLPAPVLLDDDAPTDQQRQAYLVTLPFPQQQRAGTGDVLVASSRLAKDVALTKLMYVFAQPVYANPWQSHGSIELVRMGIWRELHSPVGATAPEQHDHIAVLASAPFGTFRSRGHCYSGMASPAIGRAPTPVTGVARAIAPWHHQPSQRVALTSTQSCGMPAAIIQQCKIAVTRLSLPMH